MKIKQLILISTITLLLFSCNQNKVSGNKKEEQTFKEVKGYKSEFKSLENSNDNYRYFLTTDIENVSSKIFEKVLISIEVEFTLENGNKITEKEYLKTFSGSGFDSEKFWKPNEIRHIENNSAFIPVEYKDYPISKVTAVIYFKTENTIDKENEIIYSEKDVTDLWKNIKN
jgi:hypothetical protein